MRGRGELRNLELAIGKKQLKINDPLFLSKDVRTKVKEARQTLVDDIYPGTNMQKHTQMQGYGLADVNMRYVKSVLVPESGVVRRPYPQPMLTALGRATITVPIKVNTSGNGAIAIMPRQSGSTIFTLTYSHSSFNPTLGT